MSGCPVHIWAPLMAAALPFSRAIRDRVRSAVTRPSRTSRTSTPAAAPEIRRWAPVGAKSEVGEGVGANRNI